MFSDTHHCPCLFAALWTSHEDSCAAAAHDCLVCPHCMVDITYWGRVDELLSSPVTQSTSTSTSTSHGRYPGGQRESRANADGGEKAEAGRTENGRR